MKIARVSRRVIFFLLSRLKEMILTMEWFSKPIQIGKHNVNGVFSLHVAVNRHFIVDQPAWYNIKLLNDFI